jgi:hypothetical protein
MLLAGAAMVDQLHRGKRMTKTYSKPTLVMNIKGRFAAISREADSNDRRLPITQWLLAWKA